MDGWIVSCDYHIVKPNKEIYIRLFENFNISPEECFFIDDKEENINMAKTLGMKGFTLDIKNYVLDKLNENLKENNITL